MFLAKKIYKKLGEKTKFFHFFLQFFTPHAYVNYKFFSVACLSNKNRSLAFIQLEPIFEFSNKYRV